jgi:hypothetical protein
MDSRLTTICFGFGGWFGLMLSLSYLIKDPSPTAIIIAITSPWVGGFAAYSVIYCLFALFKSTTAISLSMVDVDMLITVLTAVLTTCVVASLLRGLHGTNAARNEIEGAAAEAADEVEGDEGIEEDSTDISSKSETETETETETEGTASTGDSPEGVSLLPPDTDSDETDTGDQADDEADAAKDKDCFSATPTEM